MTDTTAPVQKISLFTIFFTVFLDLVGIGIALPISAPLLLQPESAMLPFHYGEEVRTILLGCLIAAYPIASFFGAPMLGALSDKYGRKRVLLLSLVGTMIGYLLFAYGVYTQDIVLLFISRVIDGFSGGNITIIQSTIADVSDAQSRTKNFGLIGMAFGLGFIFGPYIGGKLADNTIVSWFTFVTPFLFAALLSFINIILVMLNFHETLQHPRDTPVTIWTGVRNVKQAFTDRRLQLLFLAMFFTALGFNFYTQFFQVFLIKRFQFNQSDIGDYFAFVGVCIALVQGIIVRRLAARQIPPERLVRYTLFGLGIVLFATTLPREAWQVFLVVPFMAMCQGISAPNLTTIVSKSASAQEQGRILGVNQSVLAAALAIPPIIAAFADLVNVYLPNILAGIFVLIGWWCMLLFLRKQTTTSPA